MTKFYLMNKDIVLTEFWFEDEGSIYEVLRTHGNASVLSGWIKSRAASKHREHIKRMLRSIGCDLSSTFCKVTRCLSLNDSLWVDNSDNSTTWGKVNLYDNEFSEAVAITAFNGVLLDELDLSATSPDWTTSGNFGKCWIRENGITKLIKSGSEKGDDMPVYSEVLASQVFNALDGRAVSYELYKSFNRIATACELFTTKDVGYLSYSHFMLNRELSGDFKAVIEAYDEYGYYDMFAAMIIGDAVTLNVDRHYGNFGWYTSNSDFSRLTMAPIFDFNLCYMPFIPDLRDVESAMRKYNTKLGNDWITAAKYVLTPSLRSKLINLKDLWLTVECDGIFSTERLRQVNIIKNVMIDRILGRETEFRF